MLSLIHICNVYGKDVLLVEAVGAPDDDALPDELPHHAPVIDVYKRQSLYERQIGFIQCTALNNLFAKFL